MAVLVEIEYIRQDIAADIHSLRSERVAVAVEGHEAVVDVDTEPAPVERVEIQPEALSELLGRSRPRA